MDCSICLDSLENKDTYVLSCGHEFHTKCYQKCVYNNNFNMFIKCPLCRELNINTKKPYDNSYDNLKCWTKLERCKCKTKSGKRDIDSTTGDTKIVNPVKEGTEEMRSLVDMARAHLAGDKVDFSKKVLKKEVKEKNPYDARFKEAKAFMARMNKKRGDC